MNPIPGFFDVTKQLHNNMQGQPGILTEEQKQIYLEANKYNSEEVILKIMTL
ncbi:MAG: hypothetical protein MZV64_27355 [Ignavibacteriales bacterium]|nr:hypothetical protein [Ignavibacteriales bacterium]